MNNNNDFSFQPNTQRKYGSPVSLLSLSNKQSEDDYAHGSTEKLQKVLNTSANRTSVLKKVFRGKEELYGSQDSNLYIN